MFKYYITIFLILTFGIISASNLTSYSNTTFLHTDRYCYVSGDFILVKAYHLNIDKNEILNESALYVDIANDRQVFIKGEILKLTDGMASGFVRIPDSVKTGYYWLRCYTFNSLTNTEKNILQSVQIYVTNRFGNNGERYANDVGKVSDSSSLVLNEINDELCDISFDKTIYSKRSKVFATVELKNNSVADTIWSDISIKPVSANEIELTHANKLLEGGKSDSSVPQFQFHAKEGLNESKGIILSGCAKHNITEKPLANYIILMAFEDSVIRLKYCISDDKGNFSFLLNDCYGDQMAYLSVYSNPSMEIYTEAKLSLDNKFKIMPTNSDDDKNVIGYEISSDSLNVLKSIISKAYDISYLQLPFFASFNAVPYEDLFLAGKLNQTVNIDDYIELPDFIEISREILPFIRLRKREKGYTFYINDGINYVLRENPMVFVDGIPITNVENLLGWGSSKIKKVQVQIEPRYYGDLAFENGLMFIWTRKQDFWQEAKDNYTYKFLFNGYQKPVKFNFPDYSRESIEIKPDFRQILFWEPSFLIATNQKSKFEFFTSDEVGTYEVVLQGISNTNKVVYLKKYIQVK